MFVPQRLCVSAAGSLPWESPAHLSKLGTSYSGGGTLELLSAAFQGISGGSWITGRDATLGCEMQAMSMVASLHGPHLSLFANFNLLLSTLMNAFPKCLNNYIGEIHHKFISQFPLWGPRGCG